MSVNNVTILSGQTKTTQQQNTNQQIKIAINVPAQTPAVNQTLEQTITEAQFTPFQSSNAITQQVPTQQQAIAVPPAQASVTQQVPAQQQAIAAAPAQASVTQQVPIQQQAIAAAPAQASVTQQVPAQQQAIAPAQAQASGTSTKDLFNQLCELLGINPNELAQKAKTPEKSKGKTTTTATTNNNEKGTTGTNGNKETTTTKGGKQTTGTNGNKEATTTKEEPERFTKEDFKQMDNDQLDQLLDNKEIKKDPKKMKELTDEIHGRKAKGDTKKEDGKDMRDPYKMTIDGEEYVLVQDKNGDGKTDSTEEIFGFGDTKDTPFKSMKDLDTNKDGQISKEEMAAKNVKLAKVNNGKISDETADVDNIKYKAGEVDENNEAGSLDVTLANGSTGQGKETFEDINKLQSMIQ